MVSTLEEILNIAEEPFESLLSWLNPDRDEAAQKYELIRAGLIRIFVSRGFNDAEDLADITITRVMNRVPEIRDTYVGDPARYFFGVARKLMLEAGRRREITVDAVASLLVKITAHSPEYVCLMQCLKFLSAEKRELILDYYVYDGHEKIVQRKQMASELGITEGALRGRAFQLRNRLEECILTCMKSGQQNEKRP